MRGGMRMGAAACAAMFAGTVAAGSVAFGTIAAAAGPEGLPNPLAATAYDVGSNGYSQAVAIGATFKNERSEEHTSELQSLMRNSYAVFCLKKKRHTQAITTVHANSNTHK